MERDCCLTTDDHWFRYRAAAIIVEDDHVLLNYYAPGDYYYSIGGGVHLDEEAEQAVLREVREETGVDYAVDRMVVINESFFDGQDTLQGRRAHVLEFYFLMKPRGIMHLPPSREASVHWIPIADLPKVRHFPLFLSQWLSERPEGILHLVSRENDRPEP